MCCHSMSSVSVMREIARTEIRCGAAQSAERCAPVPAVARNVMSCRPLSGAAADKVWCGHANAMSRPMRSAKSSDETPVAITSSQVMMLTYFSSSSATRCHGVTPKCGTR